MLITWLTNICLRVLLFKKRNENIWLFGSWSGETYSDNAKYLFEYVVHNMPEIDAVWITKNEKIKSRLAHEKKKCYLYNEKCGRKLRLEAKYVFFTNGITDIGHYDLSHGSIKVSLWHGMPLKKLAYATNSIRKKNRNIIRLAQYIYLKIYNPVQRSITIATSDKTKELLIKSFEIKPSTVLITGQPRNDVLFNKNCTARVRKKLNHQLNEKFVLYMPTWRAFGKQEDFLENIISEINKSSDFLEQLKEQNIKLYIKPHPRIRIRSKTIGNVIIISNESNLDTQELIAATDLLITDYSSVFIDYALLNRPIYFFVPDLEEYKKNGNDLFLSFEEFSKYIFKDLKDFKNTVLGDASIVRKGLDNSNKINSIFNDPKLKKGEYCKTLIDQLLRHEKKIDLGSI